MTLRPRLAWLSSMALLLTAIATAPAQAGFSVSIVASPVLAGSTNDTLEVILTNTGPSAVAVGGFAFGLTAGSGITFTSVDITTATKPYIFAGHSVFGPDISVTPPNLPGSSLLAEDNTDQAAGFSVGVGAANAVSLGRVRFNVASGATGPIAVTLAGFPTTNFSNASGTDITNSVGTTLNSGSIVVVNSTAVPEPSSLALAGIALASGLGWWRIGRRPIV